MQGLAVVVEFDVVFWATVGTDHNTGAAKANSLVATQRLTYGYEANLRQSALQRNMVW